MAKRTTCMLAHTLKEDNERFKQSIAGDLASEKLDGHRCFWDGGITRGIMVKNVPWANIERMTEEQRNMVSTGLWSRGWKPIFAPEEWTRQLPTVALDGELWMGRNSCQSLASIVRSFSKSYAEWQQVKLVTFDAPTSSMFRDGIVEVRSGNLKTKIELNNVQNWVEQLGFKTVNRGRFFRTYDSLAQILEECDVEDILTATANTVLLKQHELPLRESEAITWLQEESKRRVDLGAEGMIVRTVGGVYACERSHSVLKYKPYFDSVGTVVGLQFGREGVEGRHLGRMGAIFVKWNSPNGRTVVFKVSGFTDDERAITNGVEYAEEHPGEEAPDWIEASHFPHGSQICFKYRELSNDGVPKEARFDREKQGQL